MAGFCSGLLYADAGGALGAAWVVGVHGAIALSLAGPLVGPRVAGGCTGLALIWLAGVSGALAMGSVHRLATEVNLAEASVALVEGNVRSVKRHSAARQILLDRVVPVRGGIFPRRLILWVDRAAAPVGPGKSDRTAAPVGPGKSDRTAAPVGPGKSDRTAAPVGPGKSDRTAAPVGPGKSDRKAAPVEPGGFDPTNPPVGCRVRAWVRASLVTRVRNPGSRDPARASARRGVAARGRLLHPKLIAPLSSACNPSPFEAWRNASLRALERGGPGAGLLAALAMGERVGIPRHVQDEVAMLGLSHLLAVSGLHLAWAAGLGFGAGRWLAGWVLRGLGRGDARPWACAVSWLCATSYAVWAGGGVPVQRAWFLVSAAIVAAWFRRAVRPLDALLFAAACVLWRDPSALFSAGAQLSFAATAALMLAPAAPSTLRTGEATLRLTATALLATAPLVAFHFGQTLPIALVSNALAVPWVGFVLLPVALAVTAVAPLPALGPVVEAASMLAGLSLDAVSMAASRLPVIPASTPPTWALAAAAALAAFGLFQSRTRSRLVVLFALSALLYAAPAGRSGPTGARLVALDVGQGDAFLLQSGDTAILVDAGAAVPGRFDRGRQIVVPALSAMGVGRLDLVIVTHADSDHRGGIPSVLRELPVERLWLPYGSREVPAFQELIETARRRGVRVETRAASKQTESVGEIELQVGWPPAVHPPLTRNAGSLVVMAEVAGRRVLFPGDLPRAEERRVLTQAFPVKADLLLVGHHGSRTSTGRRWLQEIQPRLAVVSAPLRSPFGVPHDEVTALLAEQEVPLAWTGRDGAVAVELGPRLRVWSFATGGWQPWSEPAGSGEGGLGPTPP